MSEQPNSINRSRSLVLNQPKNNSNSAKSVASVPGDLNDNERTKIREEVFQNWLQTKKLEQLRKREQEEKIKQIALEEKQVKREAAEISYAIWKHKKDEERKAKEMKERQLRNEEHQQREVELKKTVSREKVSEWMKMAKYKPRPVPSNLGLISLTVTNPPSYYNPQPWVNPEPA
ncbi:coiled-coil domain-containing protein 34-like [Macrosteles quadrilineatus]|uniref:coiled-coil domain-containing protein 34-like n=1 Tax=Macrosteles quadrilineatus TaxID=74068 RepID=UPI0023E326A6|nr:coiled-coil domain-containing protein 34-like [Macrosteles quadrilineatus]